MTDDAAVQSQAGNTVELSVPVAEDTAQYVEDADVYGISVRSRFARLGVDADLTSLSVRDGMIAGTAELADMTDTVSVSFDDGDEIARFYAYNDEEVATGDAVDSILDTYDLPGERVDDRHVAIETAKGYLRPALQGEYDADTICSIPKDDLMEHYVCWDAGLMHRDDHYKQTEPLEMPDTYSAIIAGTENPHDEHVESRLIDRNYGQDDENGKPVICEMKAGKEVVETPIRPLFFFVKDHRALEA